jgi:hypothetical protein
MERRISSSSELLQFVYLTTDESDAPYTTTTTYDDACSASEDGLEEAESLEDYAKSVVTRDREVVRREIETALKSWSVDGAAIAALPPTPPRHTAKEASVDKRKAAVVRTAVQEWAGASVVEAKDSAPKNAVIAERKKQEHIKLVLQHWTAGIGDDHSPPPTRAAVQRTRAREAPLGPVDISERCLADVTHIYSDVSRWRNLHLRNSSDWFSNIAPKQIVVSSTPDALPLESKQSPAEVMEAFSKFCQEQFDAELGVPFDATTCTGCVMRAASRCMVAPVEHALKMAANDRLTFNKKSWCVFVSKDDMNSITVTHERTELAAPGHHEGERYEFRWRVMFVLKRASEDAVIPPHGERTALVVSTVQMQLQNLVFLGDDEHGKERISHWIRDLFEVR